MCVLASQVWDSADEHGLVLPVFDDGFGNRFFAEGLCDFCWSGTEQVTDGFDFDRMQFFCHFRADGRGIDDGAIEVEIEFPDRVGATGVDCKF